MVFKGKEVQLRLARFSVRWCVSALMLVMMCMPLTHVVADEASGLADSIGTGVDKAKGSATKVLQLLGDGAKKIVPFVGKVPQRLAVLPASGSGDDQDRVDIRTAVHNNLASTHYDLLKPAEVDHKLALLQQDLGEQVPTRAQVAKALDVDGLLLVNVDDVEKLYVAAYAHFKIAFTVELYSAEKDQPIWRQGDSETEREGGVSLNPIGILTTAITSTQVLSDAVRLSLIDTLARRFAKLMPQPKRLLKRKRPPRIDLALANSAEGPFMVGDEIKVIMKAEPGLAASFTLLGRDTRLNLEEQAEGEYLGRYVVQAGDDIERLAIEIDATRVSDKSNRRWRVPGVIAIDTVAPESVTQLAADLRSDGVRLHWQAPVSETDTGLMYLIERADATVGQYQSLSEVAINEYWDRQLQAGSTYFYRVVARDAAGNRGALQSTKVKAAKAGPTLLSGTIEGSHFLPAIGSPYVINERWLVARGADIEFEAGSKIQLAKNAEVLVQGRIRIHGLAQQPVVVEGESWQFRWDATGANASEFEHVWWRGGEGASELKLLGSQLRVQDNRFERVALMLQQGSEAWVERSRWQRGRKGVDLQDSLANLSDSSFAELDVALTLNTMSRVAIDQLRFTQNSLNVVAEAPLTLSKVLFDAADYPALRQQLKGDITVDWSSVPDQFNLLRQWRESAWKQLAEKVNDGQWRSAQKILSTMREAEDSDDLQALTRWVLLMSGDNNCCSKGRAELKQALKKRKSGGKLELWLQKLLLPKVQVAGKPDSVLIGYAKKKFDSGYRKAYFKSGQTVSAPLQLRDALLMSRVLDRNEQGLYTSAWVAHLIDGNDLKDRLAAAGVGRRGASKRRLALWVTSDLDGADEVIQELLEDQNFRLVMLVGNHSLESMQNKAKRKGADLMLKVRTRLSSQPSTLSENLQRYQLDLSMSLIDLASSELLQRWRSDGSGAGFTGQNKAELKTFEQALAKVQSPLMRALIKADRGE